MLFAVHCLDRPDSLELRLANRPAHLEYQSPSRIPVGGPLLDGDGKMVGSMMVMEAETIEAAREVLANDPYVLADLFERVEIHEFKNSYWPS